MGEVWLNGQYLGVAWIKPYRFDVTNILKSGDNNRTFEIANTLSNCLTEDAITGQGYTNSNNTKTIVPTEGLIPGDQTRVPRAEIPLIESGLLGQVYIIVKLESGL